MKRSVFITCKHGSRRWKGEGVKQLQPVDGGELCLHRIVRQIRERGVAPTIIGTHDMYRCDDAKYLQSEREWTWTRAVLHAVPMWRGQVAVLLGDVFFEDEHIDYILAERDWAWFGRQHASPLTGCGCGEVFAVAWDAERHSDMIGAALRVGEQDAEDNPGALAGSPWQPYRHLIGVPLKQHTVKANWRECGGWTEDFDTVEDHERWTFRRQRRFVIGSAPPADFEYSPGVKSAT
jgi:hypothetical protein